MAATGGVDEGMLAEEAVMAEETSGLICVGIGASAGGLEALRDLLSELQPQSDMAFVIAQHLDPKHRSMLPTLLNRESKIPVVEAQDGQEITGGTIYVCPANKDVTFDRTTSAAPFIRLSTPRLHVGPKPSVDMMLTSLADVFGERAVAIILSGTGSDGAHGMRAIKAAGGITFSQDEATAKYNGMPQSAAETGAVDFVMNPRSMATELNGVFDLLPRRLLQTQDNGETNLPAYERILATLRQSLGIDFSDYKPTTILRRIERRMAATRVKDLEEYASLVEQRAEEVDGLFRDIIISVTAFFRDAEAFAELHKVIKSILAEKRPGDPVRIWVPGCATGEEVYSIAILVSEILGPDLPRYNIQIFGTDLDPDAVVHGRRGLYNEVALQSVDEHLLSRYFEREGGGFQVGKTLRDLCLFARHDLIKDPPFLRIDLVSCRNLLIYFSPVLQDRTLRLFHYVLVPGGHLFLGKSENIGRLGELFDSVNKKWRVFRRIGTYRRVIGGYAGPVTRAPERPAVQERKAEPSPETIMANTLMSHFAPPTVLVNEHTEVQHIHGDVSPYLRLVEGRFGADLVNLVHERLRPSIRALLHKATRQSTAVESELIRFSDGTVDRLLTIRIHPLPGNDQTGRISGSLISFIPSHGPKAGREAGATVLADAENERIDELEQELAATREHLQTVINELETSNEELQTLNEELQASNEELQSSNEELETSNEELQSTNEELITVNEELQVKSQELSLASNDLQNILNSVGFALLVVDRRLRITRFTPHAMRLFAILPSEVGQVITSVPCHLDLPNLRRHLAEVIEMGTVKEGEIQSGRQIYAMKIFPYLGEGEEIEGAVLTFLDRTEAIAAQRRLRDEIRRFDLVRKVANIAGYDWDVDGDSVVHTDGMEDLLGLETVDLSEDFRDTFLRAIHEEDRDRVREVFSQSNREGGESRIEFRVKWPDDSIHWLAMTRLVLLDENGRLLRVVGVLANIDDRKLSAVRLHKELALIDMVPGPVAVLDRTGKVLFSNDTFGQFFGSDTDDVQGQDMAALAGDPSGPLAKPFALSFDDNENSEPISLSVGRGMLKRVVGEGGREIRYIFRLLADA